MTSITYDALRKQLLTQVIEARREYFRLKREISELKPRLPQGIYIGTYQSNYNFHYFTIGHRDAVLPSVREPNKLTKKLHLGLSHNPRYRMGLLELEQTRMHQLKKEILTGITNHLDGLKNLWKILREYKHKDCELPAAHTKLLNDFAGVASEETIFEFILKQYLESAIASQEK